MEIEVGEYVRTKDGFIRKVGEIDRCQECNEKIYISVDIIDGLHFERSWHLKEIVSHSKNIIDLLEIGDIVKVYVFADISDDDSEAIETYYRIESKYEITELKESVKMNYSKILSILTKEQYEQNSYKL